MRRDSEAVRLTSLNKGETRDTAIPLPCVHLTTPYLISWLVVLTTLYLSPLCVSEMATPSSPALKRRQATRGVSIADGSPSPRRGRRGSAVKFDETTSIFRLGEPGLVGETNGTDQHHVGTLRSEPEEEEEQGGSDHCYFCITLLEKHSVRKFFQICAAFNLLSLMFSAPLRVCERMEGSATNESRCEGVFIQFVVITVADLVLAILYTLQLALVIMAFCSRKRRKEVCTCLSSHSA